MAEPFDALLCPLCGDGLRPRAAALGCPRGHAFDIARQGYAGLLAGGVSTASADTAAMVRARAAFLGAGHYAGLAAALAALAAPLCPPGGTVLDAGAGTGYYLAAVLDAAPGAAGLALDTSKHALRRAGRAHPRAGAARWDLRRPLPVRTGSVDVLLNVFAPRNGGEFRRVLRPGGALLVVTPTPRHLAELRPSMGLLSVDAAKEDRLRRALDGHFRLERTTPCDATVELTAEDAENAASMGPSAHHLGPDEVRRRAARLPAPLPVTTSFRLSVYRPA
ncbi:putative RNA methyltransferase [Streptomyces sparsogenes]|uniref:putative RNA methyltransferase n=1 Tax=Streptomyces sparsogenes TaxID=67365 RepID=UPI0033E318DD